jgi:ubiquinone/menaquinone biosynthesis C-methylase UbiE
VVENSSEFVGSIPEHYDTGLGPHIFHTYADDIAARVAALEPSSVLELAAGTGIVTRRLRDALPPSAELIASDLNLPMLEISRAKFDSGEQVTFQQIDATEIDFGDREFEVVTCQFGVMFFPDKDRSYSEVRRVLKPGGTYLFSVWGPWETNPFARITHEAVERFFPDDPPGFYRVPFSYHDQTEIRASLSSAGFRDVKVEEVSIRSEIPSPGRFATGLVFGNPLYDEILNRGGDPEVIQAAVADAIEVELGGSMPLQAFVIEATVG